MNKKFESHCKINENNKSKYDVYFLHGFTSRKIHQDPVAVQFRKDFTVIQCDARGHGANKEGHKEDWIQTIEDYERLMKERNKPSILIGHSMGATMALSIFARNRSGTIEKAFVISGVHGKSLLDTNEKKDKFRKIYDYDNKANMSDIKNIIKALPENFAKCDDRSKDIYLIHSKADKLVTFDQFQQNKEEYCVPNKNTLVYDDLPINDHIMPFYNQRTIKFIKREIKKDLINKHL